MLAAASGARDPPLSPAVGSGRWQAEHPAPLLGAPGMRASLSGLLCADAGRSAPGTRSGPGVKNRAEIRTLYVAGVLPRKLTAGSPHARIAARSAFVGSGDPQARVPVISAASCAGEGRETAGPTAPERRRRPSRVVGTCWPGAAVTGAGAGRGLDDAGGVERGSDRRAVAGRAVPAGGGLGRLLSVEELAAYLGVPKKTIYGCWRQWGLRGYRVGRHLRFGQRQVEEWLTSREA
jgi:excisionase family DNA binding protein